MGKKINFFIDLDDVLLDTNRLISDFKQILLNHGISREIVDDYYESDGIAIKAYMSRTYHLIQHPQCITTHLGAKNLPEITNAIEKLINRFPEYIFEDATFLLESLRGHNLFIISFGGREWQSLKIGRAGIGSHFKEVMLTQGGLKSEAILELKRRGLIENLDGFFLDDRGREIERMKSALPQIVSVRVIRPNGRYSGEPCTMQDFTVNDLREVPAMAHA